MAWRYPGQSFLPYAVAAVVGQSVGDWPACMTCHALIEAGDRAGLSERSLRTPLRGNPDMRAAEAELPEQIAESQGMFFANRLGPPQQEKDTAATKCVRASSSGEEMRLTVTASRAAPDGLRNEPRKHRESDHEDHHALVRNPRRPS
jgi:hypothetical protein